MTLASSPQQKILVPPPLLYLGGLAVGGLVQYLVPVTLFAKSIREPLGAAFFVLGLVVFGLAFKEFHESNTDLRHSKPPARIIRTGVYGLTRNPIYVGLTLSYFGIGVALGSPWIIALLVVILPVMHKGVILREEAFLAARFGHDYTTYVRHVRRWL